MSGKYYKLKEKITETELFQMLKQAKRRRFNYSISTDLDSMNFSEADHDDIDLRDEFGDIIASNDIYKIIGFIIVENIKIESVTIFDEKNNIILFTLEKDIVHFTGSVEELNGLISRLSLNPDYWIEGTIDP